MIERLQGIQHLANLYDEFGVPSGIELDLDRLIELTRPLPEPLRHDVAGRHAHSARGSDRQPAPTAAQQI